MKGSNGSCKLAINPTYEWDNYGTFETYRGLGRINGSRQPVTVDHHSLFPLKSHPRSSAVKSSWPRKPPTLKIVGTLKHEEATRRNIHTAEHQSVLKQDEPILAASCEGLRRPGQKAQVVRLSTPAKTGLASKKRTPIQAALMSFSVC
jgi:hypothetical protein